MRNAIPESFLEPLQSPAHLKVRGGFLCFPSVVQRQAGIAGYCITSPTGAASASVNFI